MAGRRPRDGWLRDERIATLDVADGSDVADDAELDAVVLHDVDLRDVGASDVALRDCALERVDVCGARLVRLTTDSVRLDDCDLANGSWPGASLQWTEIRGARGTGLELAEASLRHVVFRNCRLDLASLRFANGEDVRFEDCTLCDADLTGAVLRDASFVRCDLQRADFTSADLDGADLSTSMLDELRGVGGLRGARVRPEQLVALAPLLAAHVGIVVEPGD